MTNQYCNVSSFYHPQDLTVCNLAIIEKQAHDYIADVFKEYQALDDWKKNPVFFYECLEKDFIHDYSLAVAIFDEIIKSPEAYTVEEAERAQKAIVFYNTLRKLAHQQISYGESMRQYN